MLLTRIVQRSLCTTPRTSLYHRAMSGTANPLSSGELKNLPTRQPTSEEQSLVDDLMLLYKLQPGETAYRHYDENARFHDPVGETGSEAFIR